MSDQNKCKLTVKQELAFKYIKEGYNVFVTGPGGSGKSFLIKFIYNYGINLYKTFNGQQLRSLKLAHVYKTASTGAAAILIGGSTLHSWAGIKLGKGTPEELVKYMNINALARWSNVKILIIDEISMIDPILFDKLEKIARIIRKSEKPFGGIQVILFGDFFQLPVVKSSDFCFEAKTWNSVINKVINLDQIKRQSDIVFQNILNKIRIGIIDDDIIKILNSRVNVQLENTNGIKPTVLYAKNVDVNLINNTNFEKLKENHDYKEFTYRAIYNVKYNNTGILNDLLLKNFKTLENPLIPDILRLGKGAQVVLKINLDSHAGLINGSRGIVVDFEENKNPIVKFLNGVCIPIAPHNFEYEIGSEYLIEKEQIPLKLAWATTIHSCQGSTLDYIMADVGSSIFEYGQAYVVLSRVRSLEGLSIISFKPGAIKANKKVYDYYKKMNLIKEEGEINEDTKNDSANLVKLST